MDSRLFMEIGMENRKFVAIDKSPYERWINDGNLDDNHSHLVLQRLLSIKDDDATLIYNNNTLATTVNELKDPFEFDNLTNGLYYYQKLLIPTVDHVTNSSITLWYDTNTTKIYYYNGDDNHTEVYDIWEDFDDVYSLVRKEYPDNCFYFDDYSFTIYDLIECYVLTVREILNNYLKNNCKELCENNSNLSTKADLLLAAIMIINHLIEKGDFFEAQRILNGLMTCGNLCDKFRMSDLNNCGCGRT